jgi:hypothetical protein
MGSVWRLNNLFIYAMRSMFASRKGSLSAPVIKHGKFVLYFYSILINVCMYRKWCEGVHVQKVMWGNQQRDCTLASGEGHSSRWETFHPLYAAFTVSSSAERRLHDCVVYTHALYVGGLGFRPRHGDRQFFQDFVLSFSPPPPRPISRAQVH